MSNQRTTPPSLTPKLTLVKSNQELKLSKFKACTFNRQMDIKTDSMGLKGVPILSINSREATRVHIDGHFNHSDAPNTPNSNAKSIIAFLTKASVIDPETHQLPEIQLKIAQEVWTGVLEQFRYQPILNTAQIIIEMRIEVTLLLFDPSSE